MTALAAMAGPDAADPYSRARPLGALGADAARRCGSACRCAGQRMFFGDRAGAGLTKARCRALARRLARTIVEIDIEPFYETARAALRRALARGALSRRSARCSRRRRKPIHPVTRQIIIDGARPTAADAFAAFYKLEELRRVRDHVFGGDRCAGAADRADRLHGRAGAGRSDPAQQPARHLHQFRQPARSVRARGAGVDARRRRAVGRHAAGAGGPRRVARLDRPRVPRRHRAAARRDRAARSRRSPTCRSQRARGEIAIAVVGAHLSGMPLNGELRALVRALARRATTTRRLPALCARRHQPAEARDCCASRTARGARSRSRSGR